LDNLDDQLKDTNIKELVHNISNAATSVQMFLNSSNVKILLNQASLAMQKLSSFLEQLTITVTGVEKNIDTTVQDIHRATEYFNKTCEYISQLIGPQSDFRQSAKNLLLQAANAVQSLRYLLELLNKTPNAILTGVDYEKEN
jgi:paraquat-inducible protein B